MAWTEATSAPSRVSWPDDRAGVIEALRRLDELDPNVCMAAARRSLERSRWPTRPRPPAVCRPRRASVAGPRTEMEHPGHLTGRSRGAVVSEGRHATSEHACGDQGEARLPVHPLAEQLCRCAPQAGCGTPPGSPPGSSGVHSLGAGGSGSGSGSAMRRVNLVLARPTKGAHSVAADWDDACRRPLRCWMSRLGRVIKAGSRSGRDARAENRQSRADGPETGPAPSPSRAPAWLTGTSARRRLRKATSASVRARATART
jgi:hypothetical protein